MKYIAYHPLFEKPIKSKHLEDLKKCIEEVSLKDAIFRKSNPEECYISKLNFFGKESKRFVYFSYHEHWTETSIKTEKWYITLYKYIFNL
jgi:hypothetical protein